MKTDNLLKFLVKTVFACVVFITASKTVFAQITLDLGVLSEEPPSKEATAAESDAFIPLKAPVETKKAVPPEKPKPALPAAKPTVKKNAPKTKTAPKQTNIKKEPAKKEKYQIKETTRKDEHDKLKPNAAPVPKVKILTADNEPEKPQPEETLPDESTELKKPKISKHFLEQQRLKEEAEVKEETQKGPKKEKEEKKEEIVSPSLPAAPQQNSLSSTALQNKALSSETVVKQPEPDTLKAEQAGLSKENKPSLLNFSVFPVSGKLTPTERSVALSQEIPQESLTIKALNEKKILSHILIFEKKSYELTEEMQSALNDIAALIKKDKTKRLILYSYCSIDPAEPGKERQYALRRALMIRSYLAARGVNSLRIELRAQGAKGAGNKIPDRTDLVLQNK